MLQRPNTKLDIRNAANSLQIEGWYLGTQPMGGGGGVERRRTGPYIYIYICIHIDLYNGIIVGFSNNIMCVLRKKGDWSTIYAGGV